MPKYNPKTKTVNETVVSYEYAHRVVIQNDLGRPPVLQFHTSDVLEHEGTEGYLQFKRVLVEPYVTNETFNVIDRDGNVIGQADYDTVFGLMYSLFFHVAQKTDGGV